MVVVIGAEVSLHLCCGLILLMADLHNPQQLYTHSTVLLAVAQKYWDLMKRKSMHFL